MCDVGLVEVMRISVPAYKVFIACPWLTEKKQEKKSVFVW
jgi:hypothetical protein